MVEDKPELADRYGITALPTLVLERDGQVVDIFVGYAAKELKSWLMQIQT
jgi:thioredoxin-like negative regulator of GroEL